MDNLLTTVAYNEFSHGNYAKALEIYKMLSKILGSKNYSYNIKCCQEKIVLRKFHCLSILDEISNRCLSDILALDPLLKDNYADKICSCNHPILIESCWHGNNDDWLYAFTSPGLQHKNAQTLVAALKLAKKNNHKIIFWNKEDPMHYDKFLPIAKLCDIVFTTDSNCISKYKKDIPNAQVGVMPFAANVEICNPIDRFRVEPQTVCFAGSYYAERHEDRKKQMDLILPAIIEYNGIIYDRMSNIKSDTYKFPDIYSNFIKPAVTFDEIVNLYKTFLLFLNVNTITNSPTMMSRRVYELLACGTPVLSTPSEAIESQFGNIVQVATTTKEAISIAGNLISDSEKWGQISHVGYREVMKKHTYKHRFMDMARYLNISIPNIPNRVSMIIPTKRPQYIDRIVQNISRQVHKNKEAIVITQDFTEDNVRYLRNKLSEIFPDRSDFTIIQDNSNHSLGERLNIGIQKAGGDIIAKIDDDDLYFENYLSDIIIPFGFSSIDIVGKKEVFIYIQQDNTLLLRFKGERHKFTNFIAGPTITARRNVFLNVAFRSVNNGEDSNFLKDAQSSGYNIYASDPYNFIQFRAADISTHTWKVDNNFFYKNAKIVGKGLCEHICVV